MNLQSDQPSGYSYKEWKCNFYPEDLPAKEMLAYYSRRLPAVEINNTFYRLPQAFSMHLRGKLAAEPRVCRRDAPVVSRGGGGWGEPAVSI
jgi:hypothetical protein